MARVVRAERPVVRMFFMVSASLDVCLESHPCVRPQLFRNRSARSGRAGIFRRRWKFVRRASGRGGRDRMNARSVAKFHNQFPPPVAVDLPIVGESREPVRGGGGSALANLDARCLYGRPARAGYFLWAAFPRFVRRDWRTNSTSRWVIRRTPRRTPFRVRRSSRNGLAGSCSEGFTGASHSHDRIVPIGKIFRVSARPLQAIYFDTRSLKKRAGDGDGSMADCIVPSPVRWEPGSSVQIPPIKSSVKSTK